MQNKAPLALEVFYKVERAVIHLPCRDVMLFAAESTV